uniref:Putative isac anti-complement n=1 Tax=Ixodes ricinus TaxID=34613 RepID=A0A0K8R3E5_IXORI
MEIKWMLAYILLSSSLVFGNATKGETFTKKATSAAKEPAPSKATPAQKETTASTNTQGMQNKTAPKTTAASRPSTDPIICGLKNNNSDFALPSLQCTLLHLPQNLTADWNKYMEKSSKNVSGLLNDICEAENDKAMVYDTSTLCRIRHTTKSECEIPNLIE